MLLQKLSNNYSMAEESCAVPERTLRSWACTSTSSALLGEPEGISSGVCPAVITTRTITYEEADVFVTVKRQAKVFAASNNNIPPVTLLSVYFELPRWLQAQTDWGDGWTLTTAKHTPLIMSASVLCSTNKLQAGSLVMWQPYNALGYPRQMLLYQSTLPDQAS